MSRQMACQLSRPQVTEYGLKVLAITEGEKDKFKDMTACIDAKIEDPKERIKCKVAAIAIDQISKAGCQIEHIQKVICWREPDGKPGKIEVELTRDGIQRRFEYKRELERDVDADKFLKTLLILGAAHDVLTQKRQEEKGNTAPGATT